MKILLISSTIFIASSTSAQSCDLPTATGTEAVAIRLNGHSGTWLPSQMAKEVLASYAINDSLDEVIRAQQAIINNYAKRSLIEGDISDLYDGIVVDLRTDNKDLVERLNRELQLRITAEEYTENWLSGKPGLWFIGGLVAATVVGLFIAL